MQSLITNLLQMMQNNYLIAPIIAFITGVIVAFLPCSFSSTPLLIFYLSGDNKKKAFKNSLIYSFSSIIMFVLLGLMVGIFSQSINFAKKYVYIVFGIILMFFILIMLRYYKYFKYKNNK